MTEPWYTYKIAKVLTKLNTQSSGLTLNTAQDRLKVYGPNILKSAKKRSLIIKFFAQFNHLLIYVLLVSATISALLNHWVDMSIILGVVLINALIGMVQEGRAERALDAIRQILSLQASVTRNGRRIIIPAETLVPGDIVLLKSGDKVPADLRLIDIKSLQIQEAILTGESLAVEKSIEPVDAERELGNRRCMAYSGTFVTYGKGTGVVVATGENTEIGRIGSLLNRIPDLMTPLLKKLNRFAHWLTIVILVVAAITFLFGILIRHYPIRDMFMAAVSLAVAAIPEGLPAIITISLAIGVTRMAKRNAIIRHLPAVETLGSVTVICTDKTGTLTRNELTVQHIMTAEFKFNVTGAGYGNDGDIQLNKKIIDPEKFIDLNQAIQAAVLCNDAELMFVDNEWCLHGNPIDGAFLSLGLKAGLDLTLLKKNFPLTDLIPFESEHKFMATLHHDHTGKGYIYVKGAPERILEMCSSQFSNGQFTSLNKYVWTKQIDILAEQGQRVLAIAMRPSSSEHQDLRFNDVENGLTMLALFGLLDPPREEAINAIAACQSAGIRIKMITGDYAATARSIAMQLGIKNCDEVLSGHQLDALNSAEFCDIASRVDIYARTSPIHKLKLVEALQSKNCVVAMTGDGVNDAPALKRADVGIAMGKKGTEAAKEVSAIVLADDNFASIVSAVKEGRTVYENILKTIIFILPTDGGEALIIITAILFGWVLPITPLQILWINTITAVTLGLALAFEPPEQNVMAKPPRRSNAPIFSSFLMWRILFVSLLMMLGGFGLFIWARETQASLEVARTITVNALVIGEIAYLFNTRTILTSALSFDSLLGNKSILISVTAVILFQLLFSYLPWMHTIFGTASLNLIQWVNIVLFGVGIFLLVELEKLAIMKYMKY